MNTIRKLLTAVIVLFVLSLDDPVQAQGNTIDEDVFWLRLGTTQSLLEQAIQGDERAAAISQINDLWKGISTVRLADGTTIPVDLDWLDLGPSSGISELQRLQDRVQALLNYHAQHTEQAPNLFVAHLKKILQDHRFKQEEEGVTETNSRRSSSGNAPFSPFLSQLMIFALALLAITTVAFYVWKNLQVQGAEINLPEADAEPVTSQAAAEKAEQSTATQDFRTAIRYLYLASLLWLDEHGIIHYDPALTNREHLQQLSDQPYLRQEMQSVVDIFDRVWYGMGHADQQLYQTFRQHIDQLRRG